MSKRVFILGDISVFDFQELQVKLIVNGYIPINPPRNSIEAHQDDTFQYLYDCDAVLLTGGYKARDLYLATISGKPFLSKMNYEEVQITAASRECSSQTSLPIPEKPVSKSII